MKNYRRGSMHNFTVRYKTKHNESTIVWAGQAQTIEQALLTCQSIEDDGIALVEYIDIDGEELSNAAIDKINKEHFAEVNECDGGAAGGDAGGASAGGDAGAVAVDAGDTASEMAGTSTADVIGTFDPKKGVMGVGNFMVPSKVKVPLHRWEVCNGGSKRKKDKKGKDKKYAYEKGMKVVVDMLEKDGNSGSPTSGKKKIFSRLKRISKGVKSMDDVKAVEAKIEKEKSQIESRFSKSSYSQIKQMFTDFCAFIKDICAGKYKASWFAVTMVTVGLIYIISPIDLIPDAVPVVGVIDDAFVLKLIYDAVKDEIDNWKSQKTADGNRASMH